MILLVILLMEQSSSSGSNVTPTSFFTLIYFALASLITLFIETLRRWIKRRMDIWEANNPLPETKAKQKKKEKEEENHDAES